jgi:hypothetical protein
MMMEGTVPVPRYTPALSDDNVFPVRDLSHLGNHSGGGETPMSIYPVFDHFSRDSFQIRSAKELSDLNRIINYASEDPHCMAVPACLQFPCEKQSYENASENF